MLAMVLLATACADDPMDFCGAAEPGLAPFDAPDAVEWWRTLEANTDGPRRDDVIALRVVAEQVAALGPDASADQVAARVLRPRVAGHVVAVTGHVREMCGS